MKFFTLPEFATLSWYTSSTAPCNFAPTVQKWLTNVFFHLAFRKYHLYCTSNHDTCSVTQNGEYMIQVPSISEPNHKCCSITSTLPRFFAWLEELRIALFLEVYRIKYSTTTPPSHSSERPLLSPEPFKGMEHSQRYSTIVHFLRSFLLYHLFWLRFHHLTKSESTRGNEYYRW